jgi:hypothetical protein
VDTPGAGGNGRRVLEIRRRITRTSVTIRPYHHAIVRARSDEIRRGLNQERSIDMIADDIRNADTEDAIFVLLTAYIARVQAAADVGGMPGHITRLPVRGIIDVRMRFENLVVDLDEASRQLNDGVCAGIREALHIFGMALSRLRSLGRAATRKRVLVCSDGVHFAAPLPDQAGIAVSARGPDNI